MTSSKRTLGSRAPVQTGSDTLAEVAKARRPDENLSTQACIPGVVAVGPFYDNEGAHQPAVCIAQGIGDTLFALASYRGLTRQCGTLAVCCPYNPAHVKRLHSCSMDGPHLKDVLASDQLFVILLTEPEESADAPSIKNLRELPCLCFNQVSGWRQWVHEQPNN